MKNLILLASVAFLFAASSCRSTKTVYPDYGFNTNQSDQLGQTSEQYEDDVYAKAGTSSATTVTGQNYDQNQYASQQDYVPIASYDDVYAYDQYGRALGYSSVYCQNHTGAVGYPTSNPYGNAGGMSGSAILNQAKYESPVHQQPQYIYNATGYPVSEVVSLNQQSFGNQALQVRGEVLYGPRGHSGGRIANPTGTTGQMQNQQMQNQQMQSNAPTGKRIAPAAPIARPVLITRPVKMHNQPAFSKPNSSMRRR